MPELLHVVETVDEVVTVEEQTYVVVSSYIPVPGPGVTLPIEITDVTGLNDSILVQNTNNDDQQAAISAVNDVVVPLQESYDQFVTDTGIALGQKAEAIHGHAIADTSGLQAALDAAGGSSGPTGFYVTGRWYDGSPVKYQSAAASVVNVNAIWYTQFIPHVTQAFDLIGITTTVNAAGNIRLGVYSALASGAPGALLFGSADISVAAFGDKTAAIALTLTGGSLYYLAITVSINTTCLTIPNAAMWNRGAAAVSTTLTDSDFRSTWSPYAALPDPAPTSAFTFSNTTPPLIRLRAG